MGTEILKMSKIKKSFSGVYALKEIDFSLEIGEVHALLGENGAGKSTLIKILGGIYQPDSGEIRLNDNEIKINDVSEARKLGIGIIHQEIVLVPYLTVAQNIFLGREIISKNIILNRLEMNKQASKMIDSLGLDIEENTLVKDLSIAQQQMIEIVKAVSFNAKIIVMDEPTSSLSNDEVKQLFDLIERLKKKAVSIIYISHRMEEIFTVSSRVTVIRDGAYVGTKKTKDTNVDELVAMMVGRTLEKFYARNYNDLSEAEIALEVKNLTSDTVYNDISFKLRKGEILGFSGLVGAGRSEIMESIFGVRKYQKGQIYLDGKEVKIDSPAKAIQLGIAMVPEDRKKQGLILGNSVAYNTTLAALKYCMKGIVVDKDKCQNIVKYYSERLKLKAASVEMETRRLSGGNQQKVVLAKWLATKPSVLILDEPTRGVDVNAKFEIYTAINELAKEGMAIILISSELPEIINMCDNTCVVRNGEIVSYMTRKEFGQEEIMHYAAGGDNDE